MSRKLSRTFSSLLIALAVAFAGVTPAAAQPPTNDDFDYPTVITALPYSDATSLSEATIANDDPLAPCNDSLTPSIWYAFTPAVDMTVEAHTWYFDSVPVLSVFTGSRGDLTELGCNYYEPSLLLSLTGGVTYYFMITSLWETGADLTLTITEVVTPSNDDFDAATLIPGLPFTALTNTRLATADPDDPTYGGGYGEGYPTVWYSFTPSEDVTVEIDASRSSFYTFLDVFTGSREDLTEIVYRSQRIVFAATANTTYYFMILGESSGNLTLSVREYELLPLVPGFWFSPDDPSIFDVMSFCDESSDPDWFAWPTWHTWDLGDGTSISDEASCVYHQYKADGDYTVQHGATFTDGRSVSVTQVVQVRTHDVAITRILAPVAAKAGQTRSITVYVKSLRYDETVQVALYKSVPGGTEWLGDSPVLTVPATNRTTTFTFPYTFTSEDAGVGKLTFWAFATIVDARDVLPADNEAISSPPTKVAK